MLRTFYHKQYIEAGCDEAGRGCYAGPVFAAAVVLPKRFRHRGLNDSKQLTAAERNELRPYIEEKALAWAVARVDVEEIDSINILKASIKAMHLAVAQLAIIPELLLVDGNYFLPYPFIPHHCVIKGDGVYASIAAASILAKTYRDEYMEQLHDAYPHYLWKKNKGYGTPEHRRAIETHGLCCHHRKSFNIFQGELCRTPNDAEQDSDNGNYEQQVNQASGMISEETNSPGNY